MAQIQNATIQKQPEAPPISREQVMQHLGNGKRRISQRKGELADALSDSITQEFGTINNLCQALISKIEELEAKVKTLEASSKAKDKK